MLPAPEVVPGTNGGDARGGGPWPVDAIGPLIRWIGFSPVWESTTLFSRLSKSGGKDRRCFRDPIERGDRLREDIGRSSSVRGP